MDRQNSKDAPEVYAVRKDGSGWQISRRDFLKAAGLGAAALSAGCARKKPLNEVCRDVPAHKSVITGLIESVDGKHLVSLDSGSVIKCWDFRNKSLLGNLKANFRGFSVGRHNGKSCLYLNSGKNREEVYFYELPLKEFTADDAAVETEKPLIIPGLVETMMVMDSEENFYATAGGRINLYRKADDYQQAEMLWEPASNKGSITKNRLFNDEKSLFVQWNLNNGFGVLDLQKKAMTYYLADGTCTDSELLPDNRHALICYQKSYVLTSLETHKNEWEKDAPKPGGGNNYIINAAAVTPDGSAGALLVTYQQRCWLYLISLADGSISASYALGELVKSGTFGGLLISRDGSQLAIALAQSILFFSLPDLQLIGCPMDINDAKNDLKGSEISATDEATGAAYSYTLPCGAELPPGAVCTCNCVRGRGGCACNSHSSSGSSKSGPHYWHPN